MSAIFLATATCWVSAGMWVLVYWAPHCPMPANPCRRFILISPLHHVDPWDEKKKAEDDHVPWYVHVCIYATVVACMLQPVLGFVVLLVAALFMTYNFIQQITETGPYSKDQNNKQEGE